MVLPIRRELLRPAGRMRLLAAEASPFRHASHLSSNPCLGAAGRCPAGALDGQGIPPQGRGATAGRVGVAD